MTVGKKRSIRHGHDPAWLAGGHVVALAAIVAVLTAVVVWVTGSTDSVVVAAVPVLLVLSLLGAGVGRSRGTGKR